MVNVGKVCTQELAITAGVPQGSVLCRPLFLLYNRDFPRTLSVTIAMHGGGVTFHSLCS